MLVETIIQFGCLLLQTYANAGALKFMVAHDFLHSIIVWVIPTP